MASGITEQSSRLQFPQEGSHLLPRSRLLEHPEQASRCTTARCARAGLCLLGLSCFAGGITLIGFTAIQRLGDGLFFIGSIFDFTGCCFLTNLDQIPDYYDPQELRVFKETCLITSFQTLYTSGIMVTSLRSINFDQIIELGLLSREEWREKYCRMLQQAQSKEIMALDKVFELGIITSDEFQALRDSMKQEPFSEESHRKLLEDLSYSMMPRGIGERV